MKIGALIGVCLLCALGHAQEAVHEEPRSQDDLDRRLRLAKELAEAKNYGEARSQALEIVRQAPEYWDAILLVARIDAWTGRFDDALQRTKEVWQKAKYRPALDLWVDIAAWSQRRDELRAARQAMAAAGGDSANADFRAAQMEDDRMNTLGAHRLNRRVLRADPSHAGALQLRREMRLGRVIVAGAFEYWPRLAAPQNVAGSTSVTGELAPRSIVSPSIWYEYINRFDTHNHRAGGALAWRVHRRATLGVQAMGGATSVVPPFSVGAGVEGQLTPKLLSGRFAYDFFIMPFPGYFHRLTAGLQVDWRMLQASSSYALGFISSCGNTSVVHTVRLNFAVLPLPWIEILARYAFGTEVDRPSSTGCLALNDLQGHTAMLQLTFTIASRTTLRTGYSFTQWQSGAQMHSPFLMLAYTF